MGARTMDPPPHDTDTAPTGDSAPGATRARLADQRAQLLARVAAMTGDLEALFAASLDSNADDEHDPEGQTIAYERSQHSALLAQVRTHLGEIDAALERLQAGVYGRCEVCGEVIPSGRLLARPAARACVQHAGARP